MPLTDDDAKEIIKTLALRRDNAYIIISGFIVAVLTLFLLISTIPPSKFGLESPTYADLYAAAISFLIAFVVFKSLLEFYRKDLAIRDKINEISKQPNLKEFYAGIFPEEQKKLKVEVRQVSVSLLARQIFGGFLILAGGIIVLMGYVLLSNSYLSPQSSMTGLNIIIVPLETTALYMGGLLLVIFGLFGVFGKDRVLNWAQKIKIA